MIQSDWWCRFTDLKNSRCIHVYPGGCYWAFLEPGVGDEEISFTLGDGDAIAVMLEEVIRGVNLEKQPLIHRFVDCDSQEKSAFLARRDDGCVTITFVNDLDDIDNPASMEAVGLSLNLSLDDATKLLAEFMRQLKIVHDQLRSA